MHANINLILIKNKKSILIMWNIVPVGGFWRDILLNLEHPLL